MAARREQDYAQAQAAACALALPVHLVRGGSSDLISLEAAKRFVATVPGAQFTAVSGAGHMVVGDDNDVFSRAILEFLDSQAEPTTIALHSKNLTAHSWSPRLNGGSNSDR